MAPAKCKSHLDDLGGGIGGGEARRRAGLHGTSAFSWRHFFIFTAVRRGRRPCRSGPLCTRAVATRLGDAAPPGATSQHPQTIWFDSDRTKPDSHYCVRCKLLIIIIAG